MRGRVNDRNSDRCIRTAYLLHLSQLSGTSTLFGKGAKRIERQPNCRKNGFNRMENESDTIILVISLYGQ